MMAAHGAWRMAHARALGALHGARVAETSTASDHIIGAYANVGPSLDAPALTKEAFDVNELQAPDALTDEELDRLSEFLDAASPFAMNIEMLDGYFAALICGPQMVMPSEYLPEIWGEEFAIESQEQANEIMSLLVRHWNTIVTVLTTSLDEPEVYLPVLLQDEDGVATGNDWAHGFMHGVAMRPGSWDILLNDEDHAGAMVPIMLLHHEDDPDPDPEMQLEPIAPEQRDEVLELMIGGLTSIYRYFEPYRRADAVAHTPMRRDGPKVGRNDPCPCGSGRKYKHCCGRNAPAGH
jgi:uncharacterized protein